MLTSILALAACSSVDLDEPDLAAFEAPPPPDNGVQLRVPSFEVEAHTEVERCVFVKAPHAERGMITRIELVARPGLHHASVAKSAMAFADGEVDCEIGIPEELMGNFLEVPEPIFASSTQIAEETVDFPEGVGVPLEPGQQLVINHHHVNPFDAAATGEVVVNFHFADAPETLEEAHLFVFSNVVNLSIPARSLHEQTTTCVFPDDASLLSATPHMHQLGTGFTVRHHDGVAPGEVLIESPGWAAPETAYFDPPYAVSQGDGLTFTCAWRNDSDDEIVFGPTGDDEMCTVFGYYYPGEDLLWRADYDESLCWIESAVTTPL